VQSSSPSNTPAPHHGKDFPHTTYADNVRGHVALLKALDVDLEKDGLHAVVGFSMGMIMEIVCIPSAHTLAGGQIAYHWGAVHSGGCLHAKILPGLPDLFFQRTSNTSSASPRLHGHRNVRRAPPRSLSSKN
jgi:hypothetical protein